MFPLERYEEASQTALKTIGGIVDLPAWIAAACALSGDLVPARKLVDRFVTDFTHRITFGRIPEPGEPLRWLLHVNPFRHQSDSERLAQGLRSAGLESDPDEGRPEARAQPSGPDALGAIFRREGDFWRIAFEGLSVHLSDQKGFHDLARLLASPDREIHCLELANRPGEGANADPVLDRRARREIEERHRHRYEFNREYEDRLTSAGLKITGATPDNTYVEICEIGDHPWFLGCQFHPEFKSKPMEPHPLFKAFIGASAEYRERRLADLEEPLFSRQLT